MSGRNHGYPRRSGFERVAHDRYTEPRWLILQLLDEVTFDGGVLDPCCGTGTIVSVCLDRGIPANGSDLRADDTGFGAPRDLFTGSADDLFKSVR
jgi:hypothetical protein